VELLAMNALLRIAAIPAKLILFESMTPLTIPAIVSLDILMMHFQLARNAIILVKHVSNTIIV
jgi:hypothetical protein